MTRRFFDIGLLLLALFLAAVLSRQQSVASQVRVDLVAKNITQLQAFERIVDNAELRVVGPLPRADQSFTSNFDLHDVDVAGALEEVQIGRDWKLLRDVLVLTPYRTVSLDYPFGCGRFETLLEYAPAAALLPQLESAFPDVEFTEHPTMNGFFSMGSKNSLLEMKRTIAQLDVREAPPFPAISRVHELRVLETEEALKEIASQLPGVKAEPQGRSLRLEATLGELGDALAYLDTFDRVRKTNDVSLTELAQATQTCLLYAESNVEQRVDCPTECKGPLQLLGLRNGDLISSQHVRQLAAQPEWRITRNGVPTRIILNLKP